MIFKMYVLVDDPAWPAYIGTVNAERIGEAIPRWAALHRMTPGTYRAVDPRTGESVTDGVWLGEERAA